MTFKKWLRRKRCIHDWHEVNKYREVAVFRSIERDYRTIIYCPLCDTKKDVATIDANALLEKQRIREQYASENRFY